MHGVSGAQPARGAGLHRPWGPQPAAVAALGSPAALGLDAHSAAETALPGEASLAAFALLLVVLEPGGSVSLRKVGIPGQVCSFPSPRQGQEQRNTATLLLPVLRFGY